MIICEGILLILGLIGLIGGRIPIWGKKAIEGPKARVAGIILIAPMPVGICLALFVSLTGFGTQAIHTGLSILEILMVFVSFVVVLVMAIQVPNPVEETPSEPPKQASKEMIERKILKLNEMFISGLITKEEYDQKREELTGENP